MEGFIGYLTVFLLGLIAGVIITLSARKAVKKVKSSGGFIPGNTGSPDEETDQ